MKINVLNFLILTLLFGFYGCNPYPQNETCGRRKSLYPSKLDKIEQKLCSQFEIENDHIDLELWKKNDIVSGMNYHYRIDVYGALVVKGYTCACVQEKLGDFDGHPQSSSHSYNIVPDGTLIIQILINKQGYCISKKELIS